MTTESTADRRLPRGRLARARGAAGRRPRQPAGTPAVRYSSPCAWRPSFIYVGPANRACALPNVPLLLTRAKQRSKPHWLRQHASTADRRRPRRLSARASRPRRGQCEEISTLSHFSSPRYAVGSLTPDEQEALRRIEAS